MAIVCLLAVLPGRPGGSEGPRVKARTALRTSHASAASLSHPVYTRGRYPALSNSRSLSRGCNCPASHCGRQCQVRSCCKNPYASRFSNREINHTERCIQMLRVSVSLYIRSCCKNPCQHICSRLYMQTAAEATTP